MGALSPTLWKLSKPSIVRDRVISMAELQHVIKCLGERLTEEEVDQVLQWTDTVADLEGNIKYEDFIKKVMAGQKE